jgi:hypothetical protein
MRHPGRSSASSFFTLFAAKIPEIYPENVRPVSGFLATVRVHYLGMRSGRRSAGVRRTWV